MADTLNTPYLTTVDNPYDPRDEFKQWYWYDRYLEHYTPELLDRISFTSDALPPADEIEALKLAMEEIVKENVSGVHRIVWKDS